MSKIKGTYFFTKASFLLSKQCIKSTPKIILGKTSTNLKLPLNSGHLPLEVGLDVEAFLLPLLVTRNLNRDLDARIRKTLNKTANVSKVAL